MKINVNKGILQTAVGVVSKACGGNSISGITQNVLIQVKEGNVATLTCYDDVKHITISTDIELISTDTIGEVLVDCKMLQGILAKFASEEVSMEFTPANVVIRAGKSRMTLPVQSADAFPRATMPDTTKSVCINTTKLKEMVSNVAFAASGNNNNQVLTGINLVKVGTVFTLTALDGHRIAINEMSVENGDDMNVIISAELLGKAISALSGSETSIATNNVSVVIKSDSTTIMLQVISGSYPNVAQFLNMGDKTMTIDKREWMKAIERANLFIDNNHKSPLVFGITDNSLNLTLKSPIGEVNEDIPVETTGAAIDIAFNPAFLLDALKSIKDEKVTCAMANSKAPMIIKGEGYVYLILPVNFTRTN